MPWFGERRTTDDARRVSNAFALTPNQDTWKRLYRLPRLSQGRIWPMPARVIRRMSRWAGLSIAALSTIGPVQHGFMRSRRPIFVYKKSLRLSRSCRGLCDQASLRSNSLQLRARVAADREEGLGLAAALDHLVRLSFVPRGTRRPGGADPRWPNHRGCPDALRPKPGRS